MLHRASRDRFSGVAWLALATLALVGCSATTWQVQPYELEKLDGWRPGAARPLIATDGEAIPFHGRSRLAIGTVDGVTAGDTYQSIDVMDGQFAGRTTAGEMVSMALASIRTVTITDDVPGERTRMAALGTLAGAVLVGLLAWGIWLLFFS